MEISDLPHLAHTCSLLQVLCYFVSVDEEWSMPINYNFQKVAVAWNSHKNKCWIWESKAVLPSRVTAWEGTTDFSGSDLTERSASLRTACERLSEQPMWIQDSLPSDARVLRRSTQFHAHPIGNPRRVSDRVLNWIRSGFTDIEVRVLRVTLLGQFWHVVRSPGAFRFNSYPLPWTVCSTATTTHLTGVHRVVKCWLI